VAEGLAVQVSVIFHSSLEWQASPVVSLAWWGSLDDLYRQVWTVARWGNDPDDLCGKFLSWCFTQPQAMAFVHSLPGIPWAGFETDAEVRAWYERLVTAAASWDPPALMADVDGGPLTQAGEVRWSGPAADTAPGAAPDPAGM
jgi:hypothetical protein